MPTIALAGLEQVHGGSLEFSNINIGNSQNSQANARRQTSTEQGPPAGFGPIGFAISVPNLNYVEQSLDFKGLTNVLMPGLKSLGSADSITFTDVKFINQTTSFGAGNFGALNNVRSLSFVGTNIASIAPANPLEPPEVADVTKISFVATRNTYLESIEISGFNGPEDHITIDIQNNEKHPSVAFPNVLNAFVTLNDARSLTAEALQQLSSQTTNQSQKAQIINHNTFSTLELPSLQTIDGTLEVKENKELSFIKMPQLTSANDLKIENNQKLAK